MSTNDDSTPGLDRMPGPQPWPTPCPACEGPTPDKRQTAAYQLGACWGADAGGRLDPFSAPLTAQISSRMSCSVLPDVPQPVEPALQQGLAY